VRWQAGHRCRPELSGDPRQGREEALLQALAAAAPLENGFPPRCGQGLEGIAAEERKTTETLASFDALEEERG
jgi:hypothetical protein